MQKRNFLNRHEKKMDESCSYNVVFCEELVLEITLWKCSGKPNVSLVKG